MKDPSAEAPFVTMMLVHASVLSAPRRKITADAIIPLIVLTFIFEMFSFISTFAVAKL